MRRFTLITFAFSAVFVSSAWAQGTSGTTEANEQATTGTPSGQANTTQAPGVQAPVRQPDLSPTPSARTPATEQTTSPTPSAPVDSARRDANAVGDISQQQTVQQPNDPTAVDSRRRRTAEIAREPEALPPVLRGGGDSNLSQSNCAELTGIEQSECYRRDNPRDDLPAGVTQSEADEAARRE